MNTSLVKQKPLENLFICAEEKRKEMIAAEVKRVETENRMYRNIAVQEWAERHLYVTHPLTDDEKKILLLVMRKWHAKTLVKNITGWLCAHGIFISSIGCSFFVGPAIGVPLFILGFVGSVALIVGDVFCFDEYSPSGKWFHSRILQPIRFLKHGHWQKKAKAKIPAFLPH